MAASNETPNIIAQQNTAVVGDLGSSVYWLIWKPSLSGTLQDGLLKVPNDLAKQGLAPPLSFDILNPGASEKHALLFTKVALTVSQFFSVLSGSSTPSVTYSIRYGTDFSGSGTEIKTGGVTTTSTTTGDIVSSGFTNPVIPANNLIWLTTSAQSGTVTEMHVTVSF